MKTLITGGCGFIGSHLAEQLLEQGHEVIILDNLVCGRMENLTALLAHPKLVFEQVDICDYTSINTFFRGVDWVFHLAGLADIIPSIEEPLNYFNVNVAGTLNVLQCARQHDVKRFVYAASSSSYGIPNVYPTSETSPMAPLYPYALTKLMGEELVLHWSKIYKLSALSLRLFNVYGPRSRTSGTYGAVFGVFLAQKFKGKPFTVVGDGTQTRDFTYVTDVAEAFIKAAQSEVSGEAMNVGSGKIYSINHIVELLDGPVEFIPKRPGEPDCTFADIRKINTLIGWAPKTDLEVGVDAMLKCISNWKDAPVWNSDSIDKATVTWFHYLGRGTV
jgi:UDP-glucose 4-epimerase